LDIALALDGVAAFAYSAITVTGLSGAINVVFFAFASFSFTVSGTALQPINFSSTAASSA